MANRYWVGGTANWDGTAGTKWALTSGGLGGQAVPTSADDVFFDSNSGTGTVTIAAGNTGAKSISCTGTGTFAGTLTGTAAITVSGSITLVAGMTYSYTGTITINATATLITASKALGSVTINGSGITVTLGDAFNHDLVSGLYDINLTQGTFDTANYTVTANRFISSNSNTRTVNLGSSTVTLYSGSATGAWNCTTATNLTVNAGTSTISLAGAPLKFFRGGGKTYYILNNNSFNPSTPVTIRDSNTFNDITCSATGNHTLNIFQGSTQTVTNFTYTPSADASVILTNGDTVTGTSSISKSSGTVTVSRFIIKNMIGTGGATWNANDSVDLGNNTGWNFTAAPARYWVGGTDTWDTTAGSKWATSSGGAGGASVPAAVTPVYFDNNSGANTVTIGSNGGCAGLICTGFTGTLTGSTALNLYGELTLVSGMTYSYTGSLTFNKTCTITSGGKTLGSVTIPQSGQTITLGDACTLGTTNTFTLTIGTLDLNGNTLSTGIFSSNTSTARAITFGSANIALTSTTGSTTILSMATATGFTFTGTGGFTRNMAATATVVFGTTGGTTSNAPNLTVNAGSSALTITSGSYFKNVDFTGSTSSVTATYNAAGNLTLASGGTYTSLVPTFLVSGTLTSVGKTLGDTTVNGSGITVTLGDACTLNTTSTFTLTSGTLNLNGNTLSTGIFSSSNSNTRAITFGSQNIALTSTVAAATVLSIGTATNFSMTTSGGGFTRNQAATATVNFGIFADGTASNAPNLTVNAGSSTLTINSSTFPCTFKNLNFTGSTCSINATNIPRIAGNLTLASGGTYTFNNYEFIASGTFTSAAKSISALNINGSGITVTLADAANCATLTLTNGTLDLAGFTYTVTTSAVTAAGTKNLTFNGGTLVCSASSATAWNNAQPTNFTTTAGTGTGIISMTGTGSKTFVGGGSTYNCTLRQGGGSLVISGSNTFSNIENSTQPVTVQFTAGTTQTFTNFSLTGTAGNLVTINSSSAGSQATLSKSSGTVSVNYLSIRDSNATGGAAWYAGTNSTNVSNNTGWIFTAPPGPSSGSFLMFLS